MHRSQFLLGILALAACGPTREERQQAVNRLVGLTEAAVVSQLGLPARTHEADGVRFLAYEERHRGFATGIQRGGGVGPDGWHHYGYVALSPPTVDYFCVTTVEIAAGRVRQITLRGDGCGM